MRTGTNTSDFSFEQLRSSFDRSATLAEKARAFIAERIDLLSRGLAPRRLEAGPHRVLHIVPIGALSGRQQVNLQDLHGDPFIRLLERDWGGGSRTFNLDGLVIHPGGDRKEAVYSYALAFRNGAFEAVSLTGRKDPERGADVVWSRDITNWYLDRCKKIFSLLKDTGFSGPAVVSFALLGVHQHVLATRDMFRRFSPVSDRDKLLCPEVWIDNLEDVVVESLVRPILDVIWQSFGLERCEDFDATTGRLLPQ